MKIALFPGSFDPVTKAHVDIVKRSVSLFDKVYIGIGVNNSKQGFLSIEQREQMLRAVFGTDDRIHVIAYEGLTVNFCKEIGASYMIRGIRTVSDFEYEMQMAQINQNLGPQLDTIFLITKVENNFVSSSIVKEISFLGGDISQFVPEPVNRYFKTINNKGRS